MGTGLTTYTTLTSARATLIKLLTIATKDQLFQFNGDLYKQNRRRCHGLITRTTNG